MMLAIKILAIRTILAALPFVLICLRRSFRQDDFTREARRQR